MEEARKFHDHTPVRPTDDTASKGLLFASRFRSLLVQYGVGKYFRPFHRMYTKPDDLPQVHMITLKGTTEASPAGVVHRLLRVEVDVNTAQLILVDCAKKSLIKFTIETKRKPHLVLDPNERADLMQRYGKFPWPKDCPPIPETVLCFYIEGKEEPMLTWYAGSAPLHEAFVVMTFLLNAVRHQLAEEIDTQDDFSAAVEDAIESAADADD